jgi:radical SAM superfamily enzyme YgiQ (UPF0313 family)
MPDILLSTLNARYSHASLGLRYLRANLDELREQSQIIEFVIGQKTEEMVEKILAQNPKILGLGVYIWNIEECTKLVAQLKTVAPDLIIVLGGPEVSYEVDQQRICALADYVITGWGDVSFAQLARQLINNETPHSRVIPGIQAELKDLVLPYREYTDEDVRQRHLYVEASRGCPFKCEFCLSALDKTAWPFELKRFLDELEILYQRGARQFKFVDRTFNLKIDTSVAIMQFFLDKLQQAPNDPVFAHFELIPDHLPDKLKEFITQFPDGTLQFEIGIQTFNPEIQQRISRKQNDEKARHNLQWLREHSKAHLHVDLIAGLPGEDIESFAEGFNRLVALAPHEIQFGILKRLRGAPIIRHTQAHSLRFNPDPPYNILSTDVIDFASMQQLSRFARYWDMVANSGRFSRSLPLLLADSPFQHFFAFSQWLYAKLGQTHAIAQERLVHALQEHMVIVRGLNEEDVNRALIDDYRAQGGRTRLAFEDPNAVMPDPKPRKKRATPSRQARHLAG